MSAEATGSEPPAPTPGSVPAPAAAEAAPPTGERSPAGQATPDDQLPELRSALRHTLPPGVSASVRLATGRTVYVTVADLSRTGACVVRRGSLEVQASEEVLLDVSDYEQQQNVVLKARVQWVNTRSYNTLVGLLFTDGPLLPGSMLDQYLDQPLMPPGTGEV